MAGEYKDHEPSIESVSAMSLTLRSADLGSPSDREFAKIVRQYQGPLFGFLGRMGFTSTQAQDLAQDTFVRAWRHAGQFDSQRAQYVTWLFAIARNLAHSEWSKPGAKVEHAGLDMATDVIGEAPSSEETIHRAQRADLLRVALRELSMDERSTLGLAYVQELDMASIARIEQCSVAAIKSRLHRAKLKLREQLEKNLA
jgi:RNA polymerase sigma-70 factor, ECF subfamily